MKVKKLALKHHPDKGGDAEMFKRISDAIYKQGKVSDWKKSIQFFDLKLF